MQLRNGLRELTAVAEQESAAVTLTRDPFWRDKCLSRQRKRHISGVSKPVVWEPVVCTLDSLGDFLRGGNGRGGDSTPL